MSDDVIARAVHEDYEVEAEAGDQDDHGHPSDRSYVRIAVVLAVLTAAEVATFYFEDQLGGLLAPSLIVMMIVKFFLVAAWFMHLRFDHNLFTRVFVSGLALAVAVYMGALASFKFFG
jgi:cytochrome c oxidase subunit 4